MREWQGRIGFKPRKIRHWSPSWQHSSSGAISSYLWVLSLIVGIWGAHTQFTFQKYPHWGPPLTPLGKQHVLAYIPNYVIVSLHSLAMIYLLQGLQPSKIMRFGLVGACCEGFVAKSGVHTTSNQTCALDRAVFGLSRCSQQLPLGAKLRNFPVRGPHSIHIFKTPPFGASVDLLWESTFIKMMTDWLEVLAVIL